MGTSTHRRAAVISVAAVALMTAGCSNGKSGDATPTPQASASPTSMSTAPAQPTPVTVMGESNVAVTLTGPIAAKYSSATEQQKQALGKPLTGDRNAGTRDSGLVFQQFEGGVITARDDVVGTQAYITLGKIREAWNVPRGPDGTPAVDGTNGSAGPLGYPISDQITVGDLLVSNFEHGKIEYNPKTTKVEVAVNGKVVPSGL